MNKIPTIFVRDMSKQPALVTPVWTVGCEWVRDGEGVATRKYDGSCCLIRDGKLYKRRELRRGDAIPADFENLGTDENTGKTVGWVPVMGGSEDRWHLAALASQPSWDDGTYELIGPKTQGNKDGFDIQTLIRHGATRFHSDPPRDFDGLKELLEELPGIEGIVWHHPDGRMAKIKRRDFGLKW